MLKSLSSSSSTNLDEICLICGKLTSTTHLQVSICYGCAAFYRRSINGQREYKCKFNSGKCNLKSQKILCRLCRFNKCKTLNLIINKNKQKDVPHLPSLELSPMPSNETSSDPWDISYIFHQIHLSFKSNIQTFNDDFDHLSYFTKAISSFYKAVKPKQEPTQSKSEFIRACFLKNFSINTAKLLSCSNHFQKLPLNEKLIIYDKFYQTFWYLVMFCQSIEYFGDDPALKRLTDNQQYIVVSALPQKFTINSPLYGMRFFAVPVLQKLDAFFADLKLFKPTFEEFVYICVISLWSLHDLPNISQSTHELGEKIIHEASIKLHDYYTNELRKQNYAARQAKLFRISNSIKSIIQSKAEMLKAWEFFSYGPHAFPWCKFETNYFTYKNI